MYDFVSALSVIIFLQGKPESGVLIVPHGKIGPPDVIMQITVNPAVQLR